MSIVKIRGRGQLTIPYEYRKELGLGENDILNIIKTGDVLILTPKILAGDTVSKKFEKAIKKEGITLQVLLKELREQRAGYAKGSRGKKSKA